MDRYVRLAALCLVALAIISVFGIMRTRAELRSENSVMPVKP
jgi:hypothetical protein